MSNRVHYAEAPENINQSLETATIIDDFLPSPSELVKKSEKERITIAIDKHSLELFKEYARRHDAKYQTMMNGVLSSYAEKFLSLK